MDGVRRTTTTGLGRDADLETVEDVGVSCTG